MFGSNPFHIYLKFTYVCLSDIPTQTILDSFQTPALFPLTQHSYFPIDNSTESSTIKDTHSLCIRFGLHQDYYVCPKDTITTLFLKHFKFLEEKYSTFQVLVASAYEYDALDQMPGEEYTILNALIP